ncbi:MAG: flippase, partial [Candidatus Magasanikbacteria bacterium]|nr:flippase [Candidatus Magasanikbacteria bacterium]
MTKITNIAKNTSFFTFALVLQKVISFTYFLILGRNFVPDDLGKYFFAISFTTIFAIIIDLGLSNVLTREIAKHQEKAGELLSSVMFIKIPLAIISLIAVFLTINLLGYPELTKQMVYFSAICMLLDSFSTTFFSCLRGFHNLKYESISSVVFQIIVFVLGLIIIKLNFGFKYQMLALVIASVYNFSFSVYLIRFKKKINLFSDFNYLVIKNIIKVSVPFAIFGIYQRLYMYLDSVFLSIFAGDKAVGLYQVSFKIIFALQFLPMAFTASLYPAFSSYWKSNREQLSITFERAMNYLIIISLPISIGTVFLADKILLLLKPEYFEAKLSLQIIMVALIFVFINFPIGSLLNACDRQKTNTNNMGIALLVSIILNLILIPKYQEVGASITV